MDTRIAGLRAGRGGCRRHPKLGPNGTGLQNRGTYSKSRDRRAFMTICPEDRVTAFIAADPDSVWDMISDVTRMGVESRVLQGHVAHLQTRRGRPVLGLNRDRGLSWPSPAMVTESERGQVFAFRAASGVLWRYRLTAETEVASWPRSASPQVSSAG
jgi:hypothetical protein